MVAAAVMIIRSHLVSGSARHLPELAPDLAFMVLLPYSGQARARHATDQSELS
jgi:hypothetical protein